MTLLNALQLTNANKLQDLLCSLILSECVYKAVDSSHSVALDAISTFKSQFPPGTVDISAVQFCRKRVSHKYLLATGGTPRALYVAFMGTKELRDVAVDVALGPKAVFNFDDGDGGAEENEESKAGTAGTTPGESMVVAHGGFLNRAQGIPAGSLLLHALKQNMRLVLCGHSLGGAVATLVMLRLLSSLPHLPGPDRLCCITFGMPALGTPALGQHIDSQGWGKYFASYALPEDPVPRLHLAVRPGGGAAAAGEVGEGGNLGLKTKGEGLEIEIGSEKELVDRLFKEETPSQPSTASSSLAPDKEKEDEKKEDKEEVKQQQEEDDATSVKDFKINVTQRSKWPALTLRDVARKARIAGAAFPRFTLPHFLSYSHFGTPLYLLSTGVSYSINEKEIPESSTASSPATAAAVVEEGAPGFSFAPPAVLLPRGLLATHRMPAYRARLLEICHRYYTTAEINNAKATGEKNNDSNSGNEATVVKVKESFTLAPPVRITLAETSLPVLYTPSLSSSSVTTSPSSLSSYSLISNFAAVNPLRRRRPAPSFAGSKNINKNNRNTLPLNESTYTMKVKVQGEGLETCTGASLRFPPAVGAAAGRDGVDGAASVAAITVFGRVVGVSRAKQSTVETLNRFISERNSEKNSSDSNSGEESGSGSARKPIIAFGDKFLSSISGRSSTRTIPNSTVASKTYLLPEVEFVFEVPTEALLQLQLLDSLPSSPSPSSSSSANKKLLTMPTLELNIFSDFAKTPVSVHCTPQTAWILPLDRYLGDTVFTELVQAAQEDAKNATAVAAARVQQQGRNKQKKQQQQQPQQPSTSHQLKTDENNEDNDEANKRELPFEKTEEGNLPPFSWREKIFQRLLPKANIPPATSTSYSSLPPLRSVLYRGLLITDISNALNHDDDTHSNNIKSKLRRAVDLLQWIAQQTRQTAIHQQGNSHNNNNNNNNNSSTSSRNTSTTFTIKNQENIWADIDLPLEESELDSLLQKDNQSLGTRLKQRLRRVLSSSPAVGAVAGGGKDKPGATAAEKEQRQNLWENLFKDFLPYGCPDVVVIVTSGETLKNISSSSSSSSEFNLSLLDAVHALVVASGRCHSAALLAVAASEAKDPAYRRKLSFISGLYGRPGAVVPIPPVESEAEESDGRKKEDGEAPSVFNLTMLQAALLAHASAAQNLQRHSVVIVDRENGALKSVFRARL